MMAETFRQYIKIRTFLGYRPKEILLELQTAFGDEAPTYASVQRWSKRFRDAIDSPLSSQLNFEIQENLSNQQINNSNQIQSTNGTSKSKRSRTTRSKPQELLMNEDK